MNIRVERIKLKRLGQKVWQFRDCEPKRVELAVLDYLASKGWRGYFTEHFDYNTTILCMMLWCNRESYYKEKRKTSEIFKSSRPAWYAFNYASDGFFFNKHKFSHKNLMEHATSFSEEVIPRILEVWKDRKIKSPIFGKAYLKPRSANELSEEFLVSYFKARGGLQYYLDYINYAYNSDLQQLKRRARDLDNLILSKYDYNDPLRNLLNMNDGNFLCIWKSKPPKYSSLEKWIVDITDYDGDVELKDKLLYLACDINKYWIERNKARNPWELTAVLDLEIWKDNIATVEVKAPNDRLQPHQREQLDLDAKLGRESWVIEVIEDV